jgi:5-methylcytosine-specific restriction endonuclease McrA
MSTPAERIYQRTIAKQVLTKAQYEAWDLVVYRELSHRRASYFLDISIGSLRDRVRAAQRRIANHDNPATEPPTREPTIESLAVALLIQRDGPNCYLCQAIPGRYGIEHIVPKSQGGTDEATNLALACPECNGKKATRFVSMRLTTRRPVYHPA